MTGLALEGVRVIDLTAYLSGPYCSMILADHGADVIKIERPGEGDEARRMPPFIKGESAPFMLWNRNKRSVALDLKEAQDHALCLDLVREADVFIENFKPGVAQRLRLGYETLAALNPRLIYCSISGFGQTGPYRARGGFDLMVQAMSGIMSVNGPEDGPPHRVPMAIADIGAGMFAAIGILAALQARTRTGRGQHVDTALYDAALSFGLYEAAHFFASGENPPRLGQAHRGSAPYQVFRTSDGWITIGANTQALWVKLCEVIGKSELAQDPRFRDNAVRVANRPALAGLVQEALAAASTREWMARFDAAGIPAGPVQSYAEVFADPQVIAREMVADIEHPSAGQTHTLGIPVKLSETPGALRRPAPRLGEHTDEVLGELREQGLFGVRCARHSPDEKREDVTMTELPFRSAVELASEIKAKRIGCRELLELYLKRVERYNPQLNAIIVTDIEGARKRADAADAALAKGESWGPLHGVPMTVKESYDVVGLPTTWGAPEFKEFKPERNAVAVDRLLGAGAVIFGKTNVPYMLGDFQSYNVIYGTTNNPWDVTRSPGGSSGGAAAALAAGLTGLEAGSDIGSSLRNPAHYCGIYALKPTFGVICTEGHRSPGRVSVADISVIGPLARSAVDLEVATSVMTGPDATDGLAWRIELPKARQERLADFRVAVLLEVPHAPVDRSVQDAIQNVADALAKAGATVSDRARPAIDTAAADQLFRGLLGAAMAGRQRDDIFKQNLEKARALAPDDMSPAARSLRAATMAHRDWIVGNEKRHQMRLKWAEFFRDYDVLLCPPVATPAQPHNHEGEPFSRTIPVNGKQTPVGDQLFWAGYAGLFYLPAAVAPAGQSAEGLPVGVQIIGGQYRDLTCIRLARLLEREYRGFVPPPGYAAS